MAHWRECAAARSSIGAAWSRCKPGCIARPAYDDFFVGRIEEAPEGFLSKVDAVVLADILEHVPEPEVVLKRLVSLQTSGTCFFISVPNVANIYVRLNLLFGRFDYMERGILDRTHLRFFTRKSFRKLLTEGGLQMVQLQATPLPLNLVQPFFYQTGPGRLIHRILAKVTQWWPTLLGYQWVAWAKIP